jgi:hypothetical protein
MRRPALVLLPLLLAALAGCRQPGVSVTVEPGSRADSLVFAISGPEGAPVARIDGITVADSRRHKKGPMPGRAHWVLTGAAGAAGAAGAGAPARLRYGQAPPGLAESGPAAPLAPGNYEIEVAAGADTVVTYFEVAADGSVK